MHTPSLRQAQGVHTSAILGTLATWTRRGWSVVFAALRYLTQPLAEAERLLRTCSLDAPASELLCLLKGLLKVELRSTR